MSNKDCRPSTLRAVIEAIESDESLTKAGKTNLTTGIRTFCRCVRRDASEIDANPVALRALTRYAKPKLIGVSTAHFRNSFSRLKMALDHVGIPVDRRRNMPLTPAWEAVLSPMARGQRADLRKFAGRCTALGIEPEAVTQEVFEGFCQFLNEQSTQRNVRERGHRTRRAWTKVIATEGTSFVRIANPFHRGEGHLALHDFPPPFVAELKNFQATATKLRVSGGPTAAGALAEVRERIAQRASGGRRKPLSPVTAAGYASNFVLLAGYLVKDGMPIEQFRALHILMDPGLIFRGLERMQADIVAARSHGDRARLEISPHDPNQPLPIVTATAFAVLSIAKFLNVDRETLSAIKALAAETRVQRQTGLTPKNKARLHQLADPHAKSLLLNLPATVFKRHAGLRKPTYKQAREIQDALVLAFLLEMPIRIKNVAHLDLERHFMPPIGEGRGRWLVSIPGHEVKNGQGIDGELSEETSAMLDFYIKVFRPVLCDKPSSSLFVGSTGKAKRTTTYATQFRQFIQRETDLLLNPHLMRHLAANRVIDADPRDAEVARQLLGHRSIDTTRKFYVDPSSQRRAFKAYQDLNRRDRAEINGVPKADFDFGRRKRRGHK